MSNQFNLCRDNYPFDYFRDGNDVNTWLGLPRVFAKIGFWRNRSKQRAYLKNLDDHLLEDIGLSRKQVNDEAKKTFWVD